MSSTPVLNIGWTQGDASVRLLSNFAPTPFTLDGVAYGSFEAFWQALKFPDGSAERAEVAALADGVAAKQAGKRAPRERTLTYGETVYQVGGAAHHRLAERALRAKYAQHAGARQCLLATGDATLTHVLIGRHQQPLPDSPAFPAAVFCGILTRIRGELAAGTFLPDLPMPASDVAPPATDCQMALF